MRTPKTISKLLMGTLLAGSLTLAGACDEFLDVNTNPNGPETVSANLYLSPMLHWMVTSPLYEGRFVGRYTQQWTLPATTISTWDRMGYDPLSDNGAQQWRDVYWSLGQNLVDMNTKAEAEQRWDLLGVGHILKAWGWLVLTDLHGEIVIKEAFNQGTFSFAYDSQEFAYQEVNRLLTRAIELLQRNDGAVDASYLARTDIIYGGDRAKWLKFAYGLQALQLNHFSNKAAYKPADVIAAVDKSFASAADDALEAYPATVNDDRNFYGWTRDNMRSYRQTKFVVELMNGTQFGNGTVDPRMSRMLSPSPDGVYRGYDINVVGTVAFPTTQPTTVPNNFFGYVGTSGQLLPARYIFSDKSKLPAMTYSQLQFVKAEAAYRMGDKAMALTAFRNGVLAHINFVNARNLDDGQSPTQITAAERDAYMASPAVPSTIGTLTMTHIMTQKYIAQWGWGHNELWMDMRRFHYTDVDPASGQQVFPGFAPPLSLYADNGGKVAQRIRARYNSEYVWNRPALDAIGGLALDFHTKPLWITQP
jgi:hypothetical protein